jgi:hypothetical protein
MANSAMSGRIFDMFLKVLEASTDLKHSNADFRSKTGMYSVPAR